MVILSIAIKDTLENWVLKWMYYFLERFVLYCVLLYPYHELYRIGTQVAICSPSRAVIDIVDIDVSIKMCCDIESIWEK